MPTEICQKCKEFKHGVTLYADDRICPDCYAKNELALKVIREEKEGRSVSPSRIPTPTNKNGSRKQPPRQAKVTEKKESNPVSSKSPVASVSKIVTQSELKTIAASASPAPPPPPTNSPEMYNLIKNLNDKIESQSKTIEHLTVRLNLIMSLFGISNNDLLNNDGVNNNDDDVVVTTDETTVKQPAEILKSSQSVIGSLSQEIASVKQSVIELQQASKKPVVSTEMLSDDFNKHTAITVHRTLHDVNRRKRNVVISGLKESDDDRKAFLDLCEYNLSIKPVVNEGDCRRLGSVRPGKPRLLLVKLRTEDDAVEVLRSARQLRQSYDNEIARKIYINPDLPPEAAKLAYERRKRAREMRSSRPDNNNNNRDDVHDNNANDVNVEQQDHIHTNVSEITCPTGRPSSTSTGC